MRLPVGFLETAFGLVHSRRAVHVGFYAFRVFYCVREHTIRICPIEKVALTHSALTHDLIVDDDFDAVATTKWIEVATSEMGQSDLVTVINVEERTVATSANDVVLLTVVCDEPVECAQRNATFLIDERNERLFNQTGREERDDALQYASLPLADVRATKRSDFFFRVRINLEDALLVDAQRGNVDGHVVLGR